MLLESRTAVIYGGDGSIGGAVARSLDDITLLGRAATLDDVGRVAALVASDHARTMTAATVTTSAGALIDRRYAVISVTGTPKRRSASPITSSSR